MRVLPLLQSVHEIAAFKLFRLVPSMPMLTAAAAAHPSTSRGVCRCSVLEHGVGPRGRQVSSRGSLPVCRKRRSARPGPTMRARRGTWYTSTLQTREVRNVRATPCCLASLGIVPSSHRPRPWVHWSRCTEGPRYDAHLLEARLVVPLAVMRYVGGRGRGKVI